MLFASDRYEQMQRKMEILRRREGWSGLGSMYNYRQNLHESFFFFWLPSFLVISPFLWLVRLLHVEIGFIFLQWYEAEIRKEN